MIGLPQTSVAASVHWNAPCQVLGSLFNSHRLHPRVSKSVRRHWLASALSGLLVLLVLGGSLLAVSPDLHLAFHADADHSDHLCIAVLLAHHGVAPSDPDIASVRVVNDSAEVLPPTVSHLQSVDLQQISSGRAPPFVASV